MNSKHTPGPWAYRVENFDANSPTEHFISAPTRGRICRLSSPNEEGKANALLIAAAPQLLALVKQYRQEAIAQGADVSDVQEIDDVLKAAGELC